MAIASRADSGSMLIKRLKGGRMSEKKIVKQSQSDQSQSIPEQPEQNGAGILIDEGKVEAVVKEAEKEAGGSPGPISDLGGGLVTPEQGAAEISQMVKAFVEMITIQLAASRGEHWKASEGEIRILSENTERFVNKYLPITLSKYPEFSACLGAWAIYAVPRLVAERNEMLNAG